MGGRAAGWLCWTRKMRAGRSLGGFLVQPKSSLKTGVFVVFFQLLVKFRSEDRRKMFGIIPKAKPGTSCYIYIYIHKPPPVVCPSTKKKQVDEVDGRKK